MTLKKSPNNDIIKIGERVQRFRNCRFTSQI
jgi:hypothetical protein